MTIKKLLCLCYLICRCYGVLLYSCDNPDNVVRRMIDHMSKGITSLDDFFCKYQEGKYTSLRSLNNNQRELIRIYNETSGIDERDLHRYVENAHKIHVMLCAKYPRAKSGNVNESNCNRNADTNGRTAANSNKQSLQGKCGNEIPMQDQVASAVVTPAPEGECSNPLKDELVVCNLFLHTELCFLCIKRYLALGVMFDINANFFGKHARLCYLGCASDVSRLQISPVFFIGVNINDMVTIKFGAYAGIYKNWFKAHDAKYVTNYNNTLGVFVGLDLNLQKMFGVSNIALSIFAKVGIRNICFGAKTASSTGCCATIREQFMVGLCLSYFIDMCRCSRVQIGTGFSFARYVNDKKYS